jgi:hypothetical protein
MQLFRIGFGIRSSKYINQNRFLHPRFPIVRVRVATFYFVRRKHHLETKIR